MHVTQLHPTILARNTESGCHVVFLFPVAYYFGNVIVFLLCAFCSILGSPIDRNQSSTVQLVPSEYNAEVIYYTMAAGNVAKSSPLPSLCKSRL